MRGILLFLVLGYWLIAQDQKQPIHIAPYLIESPESSLDSPNAKESISANELEQKAKKKFPLYQPIDIRKNSYGAFFIGYSYNQISSDSICLQNGENTFYRSANGVFFGLERGWQKKNFMLGGYLNGVAADDYSLSLGIRASYLIAKYIIPSIGIGYGLQHIRFPADPVQYNLHGFQFGGGIFVNVYKGFGIKFEVIGSYPMGIIHATSNVRAYGHPTLMGYSLIVSFAYYDFSI